MEERQRQKMIRIGATAIEQVLDRCDLSAEEAERLIQHASTVMVHALSETATQLITCFRPDPHAEIMDLSRQYFSGYKNPTGLTEQATLLRLAFPCLGDVNLDYQAKIECGEIALPEQAEGWFCIPNWLKHPEIFGENYSSAVRKILSVLKKSWKGDFYNFHAEEIVEAQLRQSKRTRSFFQQISDAQGNPDIFIIAAQFGLHHRDKSVLRTRVLCKEHEFCLGAFSVGCMIITHPKRLSNEDDLKAICAGDEFAELLGGGYTSAPVYLVRAFEFEFASVEVKEPRIDHGAVTAFLPQ